MEIKFLRDTRASETGEGSEGFTEGQVVDFKDNDASAYRWLRRGAAEAVTAKTDRKHGKPWQKATMSLQKEVALLLSVDLDGLDSKADLVGAITVAAEAADIEHEDMDITAFAEAIKPK